MKNILNNTAVAAVLAFSIAVAPQMALAAPSVATPTTSVAVSQAAKSFQKPSWPMAKKSYSYSSSFGGRCPSVPGAGTYHGAIDMGASDGTAIYSMYPGKVSRIVSSKDPGITPLIVVDHGTINGQKVKTTYAHMWNPTKYVKLGQKVKAGQRIADVGNAGLSSGPHLHLEVEVNGKRVDPIPFLKKGGVDIAKEAKRVFAKASPTSCKVYLGARSALKTKADWNSKSKGILPKDSYITIKAGESKEDLIQVTSSKLGTGYVKASILSPSKVKDNQPKLKYGTTTKNKKYTPNGSRHLFDYPGDAPRSKGILDTVQRGTVMTTTGKTRGKYVEVKVGKLTGWVVMEYVKEVYTPTKFQTVKKGNYVTRGNYNIQSTPVANTSKYYVHFTKLPSRVKVVATGKAHGNYMQVKYGKTTGWMQKGFLKKI